jgi:suppressor of ftsI
MEISRIDTVVGAETRVQLAVAFPPYRDPLTPYMYHCHLMWHEDQGMMAQFTVVDPDQWTRHREPLMSITIT